MRNIFNKIRNFNKSSKTNTVSTAVKTPIETSPKDDFPPIKLFISVDQLNILDKKDDTEDREIESKKFLNKKKFKYLDKDAYSDFEYEFEEFFIKLGNAEGKCPYCNKDCKELPSNKSKCLSCSQEFLRVKRPQDGKDVFIKTEEKDLLSLQWENVKDPDLVERISTEELEVVRQELESHGREKYTVYDAHFDLLKKYTPKALLSGRFRLYTSLIYYLAEHDRYDRKFTKALTYYFYVYYLQLNGASNSVVFGDKVRVNPRITERISSLLNMIDSRATDCKGIFEYAIRKTTVFENENLPYSISQAYEYFVNNYLEKEPLQGS